MRVSSVKRAIAESASAVPGLNTYRFAPPKAQVPCLYVGEVDVDYDQTFGGDAELVVTCYVLTSMSDSEAGQELLDDLLSPDGSLSVKKAIEADPALGGACDDLHIATARGYRMYKVGENDYYGAKLPVRVIGVPSQE
jgi:hypothetical protein